MFSIYESRKGKRVIEAFVIIEQSIVIAKVQYAMSYSRVVTVKQKLLFRLDKCYCNIPILLHCQFYKSDHIFNAKNTDFRTISLFLLTSKLLP